MSIRNDHTTTPVRDRMRDLLVEHAADEPRRAARTVRNRAIGVGVGFGVVAACGVGALAFAAGPQPVTELAAPLATATPTVAPPAAAHTDAASPVPGSGAVAPAAGAATAIPAPGLVPITPTVAEFQAAVTAAGFDCSTWQPLLEGPAGMTAGGTCVSSDLTLALFAAPADVDRVLALNGASLESARFLTGPDWIVSVSDVHGLSDDLIALQSHLGGTLTW